MTTPRFRPICMLCEHYVPGIDNPRNKPICAAFPEGIPSPILHGGFDHRTTFDNETILFKQAPGVTDDDIDKWEQVILKQEKAEMLAVVELLRGQEPVD